MRKDVTVHDEASGRKRVKERPEPDRTGLRFIYIRAPGRSRNQYCVAPLFTVIRLFSILLLLYCFNYIPVITNVAKWPPGVNVFNGGAYCLGAGIFCPGAYCGSDIVYY